MNNPRGNDYPRGNELITREEMNYPPRGNELITRGEMNYPRGNEIPGGK